ncbi:hypothetical protein [Streptomyces violaceorubidus]|uniref:hypothetical protein n=1 Tax=Streptomyces violaceorubidus TaxID=284042 RepID=UPI000559FDA1|nr:hypothetical protein [Streptomyces violaceorubidus]
MQSGQEPLERARAVYEDHVRECRFCAGRGAVCQASKILRRTYNNLLRAAGPRAESVGPQAATPPAPVPALPASDPAHAPGPDTAPVTAPEGAS